MLHSIFMLYRVMTKSLHSKMQIRLSSCFSSNAKKLIITSTYVVADMPTFEVPIKAKSFGGLKAKVTIKATNFGWRTECYRSFRAQCLETALSLFRTIRKGWITFESLKKIDKQFWYVLLLRKAILRHINSIIYCYSSSSTI